MALVSLEITSGLLSLVGCDCCSLSLLLVVLWAKGIPLLGRTVLMSSLQWWQEAVPLHTFGTALFLLPRELAASVFL